MLLHIIFSDFMVEDPEYGEIMISAHGQANQFIKKLGKYQELIDSKVIQNEETGTHSIMVTFAEHDYKVISWDYFRMGDIFFS